MTMNERAHLETLLIALDASPRALHKDACGDWSISGKTGHIFADGQGYLIYVATKESARRWTNIKRHLSFCRITQQGDTEGCMHLDMPPTPQQAKAIRDAIGIRKKRTISDEAKATLASRLLQSRYKSTPPALGSSPSTTKHSAEKGLRLIRR